ncbi:ANL family adenylate-forming protein [Devosia sp.]|uniref:ANL family adenylate-forming protein n=1 Tax=Devosia sp. TaxID=1871048 RepID=UPI003BA9D54D
MTGNYAIAALERAYRGPGAVAVAAAGRNVAYGAYADLTISFALRMRALGVDGNSTVALLTKDLLAALAAIGAIGLLGARWAPLASSTAAPFAGTTHVFTFGPGTERADAVVIDAGWFKPEQSNAAALGQFAGATSLDATWMIAHSSGTTGKLKYMPISYGTLWNRSSVADLEGGAPLTLLNLFSPLSYVGARINAFNLVHGGTNAYWAPWGQLLAMGVNRIMGSPAQLSLAIFERTAPPAKKIRSVRVTGAQVTAKFVATALRYFHEVQVLYGATEAGTMTLGRITDVAAFDGSTGQPVEGVEVQILDADERLCAAGVEGIVRVKAPWPAPFYIGEPELTAQVFKDGWFYPGDLGRLDATGALCITGRTGDVLNVGGKKLNASELDEIIQAHPDVRDGYCFIDRNDFDGEILAIVATLKPGASRRCLAEIRDAAVEKLGQSKAPQRFYVTDTLPRNENGKPMRQEAAAAVGRFKVVEEDRG